MRPKTKASGAAAARKEGGCDARGLLGSIHDALVSADFDAYRRAGGEASRADFDAAASVQLFVMNEMIKVSPTNSAVLAAMRGLVVGTADYDGQLARVASWCASLLEVPSGVVKAVCENVRERLMEVRPEFRSLSVDVMARLALAERRKRIPGPNSLAAELWKAAGLRAARGSRAVDNKIVTAAAARVRTRSARRG